MVADYNRYVRNKYVATPASYTEDSYGQDGVVLPNVCKYLKQY